VPFFSASRWAPRTYAHSSYCIAAWRSSSN
jgi:hypothetical protein